MATPRPQNTRATWLPNGIDAAPADGYRSAMNALTQTLTAADSGRTFFVNASGTQTFTLPATAVGLVYTFAWNGPDYGGTVQVAPAAADGIAAVGSAVVNKALILAAATIRKGDYVTICSGNGATGVTAWFVSVQHAAVTKQP